MKFRSWCFVLGLAVAPLVAGCAAKPQVKTSSAVLAPMAGHKTYAYDANAPAPAGYAQGAATQAQIAKVKANIDAAMQAKGYTLSPTPQLLVRISMGTKTTKDPNAVRGTGKSTMTEQALEIDVLDYTTQTPLFKGTATDPLRDREPSESTIAESVPAILEPVPPASS